MRKGKTEEEQRKDQRGREMPPGISRGERNAQSD